MTPPTGILAKGKQFTCHGCRLRDVRIICIEIKHLKTNALGGRKKPKVWMMICSPELGRFSSGGFPQAAVNPAVEKEKPGHAAPQVDHFPGDAADFHLLGDFAVRQIHAQESLVDHLVEPGIGEPGHSEGGLPVKMGQPVG